MEVYCGKGRLRGPRNGVEAEKREREDRTEKDRKRERGDERKRGGLGTCGNRETERVVELGRPV